MLHFYESSATLKEVGGRGKANYPANVESQGVTPAMPLRPKGVSTAEGGVQRKKGTWVSGPCAQGIDDARSMHLPTNPLYGSGVILLHRKVIFLGNQHHVVSNPNGGWDVKRGGSKRASAHCGTKQAAVNRAREISRNQRTELVIHNLDGRIARSDSHGNDPCPPRDRR